MGHQGTRVSKRNWRASGHSQGYQGALRSGYRAVGTGYGGARGR